MKTPAEFEPIALWNEWIVLTMDEEDEPTWWDADGSYSHGLLSEKTSLTDAEVVEALQRLVEKEHLPNLWYDWKERRWYCDADLSKANWVGSGPTISAAVEEALLRLIAAEGGKE